MVKKTKKEPPKKETKVASGRPKKSFKKGPKIKAT